MSSKSILDLFSHSEMVRLDQNITPCWTNNFGAKLLMLPCLNVETRKMLNFPCASLASQLQVDQLEIRPGESTPWTPGSYQHLPDRAETFTTGTLCSRWTSHWTCREGFLHQSNNAEKHGDQSWTDGSTSHWHEEPHSRETALLLRVWDQLQ